MARDGPPAGALPVVGGLSCLIGPMLPWLSVHGTTTAGLADAWGWTVTVAGLLLVSVGAEAVVAVRPARAGIRRASLFAAGATPPVPAWAGPVAWLVAASITVGKWIDLQMAINDSGFGSIGIGLWLQAVGLVVALVGFRMLRRARSEPASSDG